MVKQKVNEKILPPNIDLLKLIYTQTNDKTDYEKMTDEELIKEKEKLLKQLREEENANRKNKTQN